MKLSYSKLSRFYREGPQALIAESKQSDAMSFGSLVDDLITSPETVKDKYFVSKMKKLSASTKVLFDEVKDNEEVIRWEDGKVVISSEAMNGRIKELKLWSSTKDTEKLTQKWKSNEDFLDNIKAYFESKGKTIVTEADWLLAHKIVDSLKNSHFTKYFFNETADVEILNQLSLDFEYEEFEYTTRLDLLHIDHSTKTVTPIDLKTGESDQFMKSWNKFRYDIQLSLYSLAALEYVRKNYPDYELEGMLYIFVAKTKPDKPKIYSFDDEWIKGARDGYKGWLRLSRDVMWHYEHDLFDYPRSMYEKGRIHIRYDTKY